jgi:inorganic pyrophosphatase
MKYSFKFICLLIPFCMVFSVKAVNYYEIGAFSKDNSLQMVVEIPAGTNKKIEYNQHHNTFLIDKINGANRIIDFLPYPGNYGFIPSTLMDKDRGGDGDALDVLLISECVETGTILNIIPLGVLVLEDSGEIDTKIIAIPLEKSARIIDASSYDELHKNYSALKDIIKLWFVHYKGEDVIKFVKWDNEIAAQKEINKWMSN